MYGHSELSLILKYIVWKIKCTLSVPVQLEPLFKESFQRGLISGSVPNCSVRQIASLIQNIKLSGCFEDH